MKHVMINFRMPKQAKGKALDRLGALHGLERKTYFWIFKERDATFRKRIKESLLRVI
jgi:hypothetical protein